MGGSEGGRERLRDRETESERERKERERGERGGWWEEGRNRLRER